MTHNRFARSRGDGDISDDDAPRLWLALLGVTLFGLFFALLLVADLTLRPTRNDAATRPAPAMSEEPRPVAVGKSDPSPCPHRSCLHRPLRRIIWSSLTLPPPSRRLRRLPPQLMMTSDRPRRSVITVATFAQKVERTT
jgi:hypothetical protein